MERISKGLNSEREKLTYLVSYVGQLPSEVGQQANGNDKRQHIIQRSRDDMLRFVCPATFSFWRLKELIEL